MTPDEIDGARLQDERDDSIPEWDDLCSNCGHVLTDPEVHEEISGGRYICLSLERRGWRDRYDTREEWEESR
jgi:hypothetical protein